MARIDAAYNYFLTTYGEGIGSRYESHKKSELRDTYNRIIRANKEAPLYKIKDSEDLGQFAIDIKEHANDMLVAVSQLSGADGDISSILSRRVAVSSDSETVAARYVGDDKSSIDGFSIRVDSLAKSQVNRGNFLPPSAYSFEEGSYSFDLDVRTGSYEFQYNVGRGDNNFAVQSKIVRLINSADVGLSAQLITDSKGNNAIEIQSKATRLSEDEDCIFNISSNISWNELDRLGIQNVVSPAANSTFTLNGNSHSSVANTFTVNKSYELTLKKASTSEVSVGLMTDTQALAGGINRLLTTYNAMLDIGAKYIRGHSTRTLYNDVTSIAAGMSQSLDKLGITADKSGHLSLDKDILAEAINSPDREAAFDTLTSLRDSIKKMASKASISPMNYVDKLIVEYKNPKNNMAFPYASGQYAGMLVDCGL